MSAEYWSQFSYAYLADMQGIDLKAVYNNCCDECEDEIAIPAIDAESCKYCDGRGCNYCLMLSW